MRRPTTEAEAKKMTDNERRQWLWIIEPGRAWGLMMREKADRIILTHIRREDYQSSIDNAQS